MKIFLSATLLIFGAVTVFMSSAVLFDFCGIRAREGNFVPYIVWTNWLCGFLYLVTAYGIYREKKWTLYCLVTALVLLVTATTVLIIHIKNGGLYEMKTLGAIAFRTALTALFTVLTPKFIKR